MNALNTVALTALLFLVSDAIAQDKPVPPEVLAARTRYQEALAAAAKPVHARYVAELQQLKSRAMTAKNLDLAVAIEAEIKSVQGAADLKGDMEARLLGTVWSWWQDQTATFQRGGKAQWSYDKSKPITWRVVDAEERAIEGVSGTGEKYRAVFDADFQRGKITEGPSKPRSIGRVPER